MKKIFTFALLCVLCPYAMMAQAEGYMKETFNSEMFPLVSFVWHDDGADMLQEEDVRFLKENGMSKSFTMQPLQRDIRNSGKHIIILWEDFKEISKGKDIRVGQHEFIKSTIGQFLASGQLGYNDNIIVADFHRNTNTTSVMHALNATFSNDFEYLGDLVANHTHSNRSFTDAPNCTDLYTAVREAIEMLRDLPEDGGSRAVYLFTAGHPRNVPGADSADQVLLLAQRCNIPVYILEYWPASGVAMEPANFAKATEGDFQSFDQKEVKTACNTMLNWYKRIDDSYFGYDYRFTFESSLKRGDDPQTVALNIKGVEFQEQYLPPAFSLKEWIKEHILLTVLVVLLILLLIALAIVLSVIGHKKKAKKINDLENQQRMAEAEAQQAIAQANSSLNEYKRQQERSRAAEKERAEQERLSALMKTKNVYPRLVWELEGSKSSFDITKPTVTIGRDAGNNLVLKHSSVSRQHAIITYDGYGFYIIDTNSTNHVIVNGTIQSQTVLHSSDTIQLGQAKIIFYL